MAKFKFYLDDGVLLCIAQNVRNQSKDCDKLKEILRFLDDSLFLVYVKGKPHFLYGKQLAYIKDHLKCEIEIQIKVDPKKPNLNHCNCCFIFALWVLSIWADYYEFKFSYNYDQCIGNCVLEKDCGGICPTCEEGPKKPKPVQPSVQVQPSVASEESFLTPTDVDAINDDELNNIFDGS